MNREITETFDRIHADEDLIFHTKERLKEERIRMEAGESVSDGSLSKDKKKTQKSKGRSVFRMGAVAAACLIIGICLGAGFGRFGNIGIGKTPSAYISIDVNPSIELCLNDKDKVICADAWNDDGKAILDCIDVEGKACLDAVEALLKCEAFQPYLTGDCSLNITVIGETVVRARDLEKLLKNCSVCIEHSGTTTVVDKSLYEEAHDHDMSFGKYNLCKQLHELDHSVAIEDCHDMSIKDIKDQINTHDGNHSITEAAHHEDESGHTEQHATETHDADSHVSGTHNTGDHETESHKTDNHETESHDTGSHDTGSHETEHHDQVQQVPQQQVPQQQVTQQESHHQEEHHQTSTQATPVPQTPVATPAPTQAPVITEQPCETPVPVVTPVPDSSHDSGSHDSGHNSGREGGGHNSGHH